MPNSWKCILYYRRSGQATIVPDPKERDDRRCHQAHPDPDHDPEEEKKQCFKGL